MATLEAPVPVMVATLASAAQRASAVRVEAWQRAAEELQAQGRAEELQAQGPTEELQARPKGEQAAARAAAPTAAYPMALAEELVTRARIGAAQAAAARGALVADLVTRARIAAAPADPRTAVANAYR